MTEQEYSESGAPIYRYDNVEKRHALPAIGNVENIEAISTHIENNIGKIECVYHEIISDLIHIDVYWVKPSRQFPFHSFVTSGMSDEPMNVPNGFENHRYAELCILLPPNWFEVDIDYQTMQEAFKNENTYWPIRWLKIMARFPHEYNTWIGNGHTIPNGAEAAPFVKDIKLGCMILLPSLSLGNRFFELKMTNEKTIKFYCLYPLYKEEMDFKVKTGYDALIDKFEKYNVVDIIDVKRKNTCEKKKLFGLW